MLVFDIIFLLIYSIVFFFSGRYFLISVNDYDELINKNSKQLIVGDVITKANNKKDNITKRMDINAIFQEGMEDNSNIIYYTTIYPIPNLDANDNFKQVISSVEIKSKKVKSTAKIRGAYGIDGYGNSLMGAFSNPNIFDNKRSFVYIKKAFNGFFLITLETKIKEKNMLEDPEKYKDFIMNAINNQDINIKINFEREQIDLYRITNKRGEGDISKYISQRNI